MDEKFSIEETLNALWDKVGDWANEIIFKLPNFIMAVFIMVCFYFIARSIKRVLQKFLLHRIAQKSIQDISAKIAFIIVIFIGFFISLSVLGLNKLLTSVLAGAGVMGLAIGLALQGTLSNTFGGVVLSFMHKIRINDYIETDDAKGFVSEISLRNVVLRQTDNNYVIVPNSKFVENAFTNYSISTRSRIAVKCFVSYDSNLQEVEDLVIRIIGDNFKQKEGEYVEFFFTEFDDSSINFMTRFWIDMTKIKQEHSARHKAIKLIKTHFDAEGIVIPYPVHTVQIEKKYFNTETRTENNEQEDDLTT
ncbi:mechanosensitive ion channel family protein [Flavobacterium sp. NG2]|uniref:mechanosensitive ion channel family protein n=1 Tax=Flavobacterium sp. NG2 TaxID=3097547 RepID=UPI002A83A448|nr:mechanosensitive ion channel family protein [Flavobacterium sp. NG2]WPR70913.1 mechanosensitive ion channel family protein [Flavobacterium sp. NG2]